MKQLVPHVLSTEHLGPAVGRTGRAIVGASAGGQYVSVAWPASRSYVVYYRTLAGTWQQVDAGSGVDLAWHSHRCEGVRGCVCGTGHGARWRSFVNWTAVVVLYVCVYQHFMCACLRGVPAGWCCSS